MAEQQARYLVTGAAGFIGSHLVEALLQRGCFVAGVDNFDHFYNPAIKRRNLERASASESFRFVEGDIRDLPLIENLLSEHRISTVVHLAARAGVRPSIEQPLLYQSVNLEGTSVVLEAMRRTNVRRLLFASSSSVYGNNRSLPFRESDRVDHPISPYAATKKAGELLCHTYHHLYGIDVACLRFFTVYGPRQRPEMAIHKFTRMMAAGQTIPMYGDGSSARDFTYIDDIIQGMLAIDAGFSGYRILNLGEAQTTTLTDLIATIGRALGVEPAVERLEHQPGDVDITYADITAARELGYRPEVSIEQGIERFVRWYHEQQQHAQRTSTINS